MNEREQKYAEAIDYLISDHSMWIDDKGRPLEYTPQREARIADFVYQAARAVMAVADAEQAELRGEVERERYRADDYEDQVRRLLAERDAP